ncbi:MAG TPA: muconolactone Delta-isomerase family protein [Acidimicrobiia bacterium]|nr:muconolactone Delta-isomerase family protein [Acidimicrobiia bacterium]
MEYLVAMSTNVPDGTSRATVDDVRAREAEHSRELAAQGHLLRLWRPPLQPGEWRTLGLFAAGTALELEDVLASMPLRIWRSDEVTPLSPHPNDPRRARPPDATPEFFVGYTIAVPDGTPAHVVEELKAREAERVRELAEQERVLRLWRPPAAPGEWRGLGLWRASDAAALTTGVASLPLYVWFTTEITPLSPHPGDPAAAP